MASMKSCMALNVQIGPGRGRTAARLGLVRITHKVDYGVRALVALARAEASAPGVPVKRELLATREAIPGKFLDDILRLLRNSGIVRSHRGPEGGWTLGRSAADITVADVIRVLEGPLASVRGIRPHELADEGVPEPFVSLWVAVRVSLRSVLDVVTIADLAAGKLPKKVAALLQTPGAWTVP
jgi:Rrf2 family protein